MDDMGIYIVIGIVVFIVIALLVFLFRNIGLLVQMKL